MSNSFMKVLCTMIRTFIPIQVCEAKRKRRRDEQQWLTSGLHVHKETLNAAKHRVTKLVPEAKSSFPTFKILECFISKLV